MCTDSCRDCLRSYDNRRLHGALDWRLALDVTALAAGRDLPRHRWRARAESLAASFVAGFGGALPCELTAVGDLVAIARLDRAAAVILGHPLWRQDAAHLNAEQADAVAELTVDRGIGAVTMSDPWTLQRHPAGLFHVLHRG